MLENKDEKIEEPTKNETITDAEKAVNEVENEVANESEKPVEKYEIPMLDYEAMDLEKLVSELKKLLKQHPIQHLKNNVDAVKSSFNSKFGKLLAEKKEAFLADGGSSIDFQFSSPIKTEYNKLLAEYKKKRDTYYLQLEKQLNDNLEIRNTIIESLKVLIEQGDVKTMYNDFQEIQKKWKEIGPVPKTRYNDTWKTYHHHVERFYDLLHLNKDFRELDFKHNLEEKLKLIEKAEALDKIQDINIAFKELQELHRLWKEEIGPVGKEHREEVWNRFSEATKKIHDRRHIHYKELKLKYKEMIDAKLNVIEKINNYDTSVNKTHNDWQKSIVEIEALRKKYFEIGKLPYSKSEAIWQQFKEATKLFNTKKNLFYKSEKSAQSDNLKKKMELVELAESLQDSDDWDATTNTMKRIQADWKKIGHVPRKYSDEIWKRFKKACNHYFDKLHERKNELNKEQLVIVELKKKFIEEVKTLEAASLEQIQEVISKWRDIGVLPRNERHLNEKFNKAIDVHLGSLNMGRADIELMKFKNIINGYLSQEDYRKLDNEQLFIRRKIDENVREMEQLENNLSFISNVTEDNPLVMSVRKGIKGFKDELDIWQLKLDYLKKMKY